MPENINSELLQDVLSQIYNKPETQSLIIGRTLFIRKAFRFEEEELAVRFQNSIAYVTCLFPSKGEDKFAVEISSPEAGERLESNGKGIKRSAFRAFNRSPMPPVLSENEWLEIIGWCQRNAHLDDPP